MQDSYLKSIFFQTMNQRVPSCELEDVNRNHDTFKLGNDVTELKWENGHIAMHEHDLVCWRVPATSQPITFWDQPRAADTLEAIVDQATGHPPIKAQEELAPWMNQTVVIPANLTETAVRPCGGRTGHDAVCSTHGCQCSRDRTGVMDVPIVVRGGGATAEVYNGSILRDVSASGTFVTCDTIDGDIGGPRLTSTTTGSPGNTSSGRDCSKSTFPAVRTACHRRTQGEKKLGVAKIRKEKAKCSTSSKRSRTAEVHNESERKRRDKINQKLTTLQKMVPYSSKTDKVSMLDEVIDYIKQLQLQVNETNMMNMPPMMPLVMQQQQHQLHLQKTFMNSMGFGMDMNPINPHFLPSHFMNMPPWNNPAIAPNPVSALLASQSQSFNMDSYSRMAALYQQMQNQPGGPFPNM